MTRGILGTILWACLAACIGVGLFFVKHEVKDQERRLNALTGEIQRNQETIHILRAEWSYLNDPIRLRALSEKHLGMHPVRPNQVATLEGVLRDGMPAATLLAAASPQASAPRRTDTHAAPPEPPRQPVKLADSQPKPRPAENTKPQPIKPPPAKPGTLTLAKSEAPVPRAPAPPGNPATTPAPPGNPATTPAKGGRTLVIQSPALAQSDGGAR